MKANYLPTKYWFEDDVLHRAYFNYEEDCFSSPRDWDNMTVIVNASRYCICGNTDIQTDNIEEWLIEATGINPEWYERQKNYGIDELINKFIKEKCVAFAFLHVYDHSGISIHCGLASGWDYSNIGFVYIPKDHADVKSYRKTHTLAETKEWADKILHSDIRILDDYLTGQVYCLEVETFDKESQEWDMTDSLGSIYLTADTNTEQIDIALSYIKDYYSGDNKFFEEKEVEKAIEENTLDILNGQIAFDFMEVTA